MTAKRIVYRNPSGVDPELARELLKKLHVTRTDAASMAGISVSHLNKCLLPLESMNNRPFPDSRFDRMLTLMKRRFGLDDICMDFDSGTWCITQRFLGKLWRFV